MKHLVLATALSLCAATAFAQAWPSKPVRIINGFSAGGPSDLLSRAVAEKLQAMWGQPVLVEAKTGANGNIAMEYAAKSPAYGYTLLTIPAGNAVVLPHLNAKLPYDPLKDFAPVTMLGTVPNVLVVGPQVPAKNLQELVALAKAQPGKLSFASPGVGATPHMAGELLKAVAGLDMLHVPYKGTTPAIADVMGGQVTMFFSQMSSALPLAKQGKVRALGVANLQRHPAAPDIPTLAEQGLPGFEVYAWYALVGPAALSAEIANKVAADTTKALQMPDVKDRLAALGADPVGGTPKEFDQRLRAEYAQWGDLIKKAGIKIAD